MIYVTVGFSSSYAEWPKGSPVFTDVGREAGLLQLGDCCAAASPERHQAAIIVLDGVATITTYLSPTSPLTGRHRPRVHGGRLPFDEDGCEPRPNGRDGRIVMQVVGEAHRSAGSSAP